MYPTQRHREIGPLNHASSLSRLACACACAAVIALSSSAAAASGPLAAARLAEEDHYAAWACDEQVLTVEVTASGYLLVDVAASQAAENNLFIDLVGPPETVEVLKRTTSAWLVAVRQPAVLSLWIDSIDPRHEPGGFDVRTGFLEDPELENREGKAATRSSADVLKRLCEGNVPAGESLLCAERLAAEERVTVDLHATAVRSFSLRSWQTAEISTLGELDTVGALYDDNGLQVAADDDSGVQENFRIVRILPPGRYFLRLARQGGSGEALLQLSHGDLQSSDPELQTKDQEKDQDLVEGEPD